MIKRRPALVCALLLSGCSSVPDNPIYGENGVIKDRSTEYAQAQPGKRLQIPDSMNARTTSDVLLVPQLNSQSAATADIVAEVPRPEFFFASEGGDRASIRPLEGKQVILVDEPIDTVWTELQQFWREAEIALVVQEPRQGLMETDWIRVEGEDLSAMQRVLNRIKFNAEANEASLNKLRIRLRPDPEVEGRTAISMQQAQIPASGDKNSFDWVRDSEELAYSNEIFFSMLTYLSRSNDPSKAPTLSGFQKGPGLIAEVGQDSRKRPLLSVKAPMDQSWEYVNSALDRAGVDVGTRDTEDRKIYLTYKTRTQRDEPKGFFDWLTRDDKEPIVFKLPGLDDKEEEPAKEVFYSSDPNAIIAGAEPTQEELQNMEGFKIWMGGRVIYVFGQDNQTRATADGGLELIKRYQLAFNRARSGVLVSVHDSDGKLVAEDAAEELLWTIKDNLDI